MSEPLNVLLVGGSGFLGSHVSAALAGAGHRVTSLSRSGRRNATDHDALAADRRDAGALARVLDGRRYDLTVDLAAWDALDIERLLTVPYAALGRYVLISTGQVCLVTEAPMPYREEHGEAPMIPEPDRGTPDHAEWSYGAGKRRAERALLSLRASHGVRSVVLRLPVMLGEGDSSLRLWAYMERLLDGGPLLLPDGGAQLVRFLYAGDLGRAVARLADSRWRSPIYHLAQPVAVPLRDVVARVAAAVGVEPRLVDVTEAELAAAGLDRRCSPWSGPWVSLLDPSLAVAEWGFEARRLDDYLPAVVAHTLAHRPGRSHPAYAAREKEREMAAALPVPRPVA